MSKRYSEEFMLEAVQLAQDGEQSINETARELGISASGLRGWIKKYGTTEARANTEAAKRIKELEKENRRLRMERDILKKATAYFAQEEL